jgi:AcrR family transcriptional regulator
MARPPSVTDDQIIDATERVFAKHGAQGLTVSEVAREVGLSRAAITLRFAGVDALKRHLLKRVAQQFEERLATIQLEPGAAGLLAIADMLGSMLKGRENLSNFWLRYNSNISDPLYRAMEENRGMVLRELVLSAMPETRIDKSEAVDLFMAQMTGSILNWQTSDYSDARQFLRKRAFDWIRLAGIPMGEAHP